MTDLVLIRAAHLLDVSSGDWLHDHELVVGADGRILEVRPAGATAAADPTIATVDLPDGWMVPGLIDGHSHQVGDIEGSGVPATTTSAAQEVLIGVRNARATLAAGFTTVRDVGPYRAFTDVALRDAIDAGWTPGPRMQCAGAYITTPGGGGEVTGLALDITLPADLRFGVVRTPAEVREKVRALVGGGAGLIKLIVTGAVLTRGTDPGIIELDEAMITAAVDEATRHGVFVAAHAHGTDGIKLAVRCGVRSIEHGSLLDDEGIELMLRHGTWLVADIYCGDWIAEVGAQAGWPAETMEKNRRTTETQRDGFRRAVAAGVRIAFGTDSGVYPHGMNAIQFGYQVRAGQSPLAAIRSATLEAAALMGWEDRVGSLASGRFADLVVLPADPLTDIEVLRTPAAVVKGGVRVA